MVRLPIQRILTNEKIHSNDTYRNVKDFYPWQYTTSGSWELLQRIYCSEVLDTWKI